MARMTKQQKLEALAAELGFDLVAKPVAPVDKANDPNYRLVTNIMSGKKVLEHKDTPWSCSVQSETYWCS